MTEQITEFKHFLIGILVVADDYGHIGLIGFLLLATYNIFLFKKYNDKKYLKYARNLGFICVIIMILTIISRNFMTNIIKFLF